MDVILLEHVRKLGNFGDVVSVKGGYARNYLLPTKKALLATDENKGVFERKKEEITKANAKMLADAKKLFEKADKIFITLIRQAGEDGRLFGSVSARDISDAVSSELKHEINKNAVLDLEPIKYLGVHEVNLSLHAEVIAVVRVIVARSETEATEAKKNFLNPPKNKDAEKQLREDLNRLEAKAQAAAAERMDNSAEDSEAGIEEGAPESA